jgi:hypothetical protein
MGEPFSPSELISLPMLEPQLRPDGHWEGTILHIDHFGNLVTNVRISNATSLLVVVVKGHRIETLRDTFGDVEPGELVTYTGSSGHLEIALRNGNAAAMLGMDIGDPIQVEGRL